MSRISYINGFLKVASEVGSKLKILGSPIGNGRLVELLNIIGNKTASEKGGNTKMAVWFRKKDIRPILGPIRHIDKLPPAARSIVQKLSDNMSGEHYNPVDYTDQDFSDMLSAWETYKKKNLVPEIGFFDGPIEDSFNEVQPDAAGELFSTIKSLRNQSDIKKAKAVFANMSTNMPPQEYSKAIDDIKSGMLFSPDNKNYANAAYSASTNFFSNIERERAKKGLPPVVAKYAPQKPQPVVAMSGR